LFFFMFFFTACLLIGHHGANGTKASEAGGGLTRGRARGRAGRDDLGYRRCVSAHPYRAASRLKALLSVCRCITTTAVLAAAVAAALGCSEELIFVSENPPAVP
jgi:hypothetical protein